MERGNLGCGERAFVAMRYAAIIEGYSYWDHVAFWSHCLP